MSYSDGPSLAAKAKGFIDLSGSAHLRAALDPGKYRKAGGFFLYVPLPCSPALPFAQCVQ